MDIFTIKGWIFLLIVALAAHEVYFHFKFKELKKESDTLKRDNVTIGSMLKQLLGEINGS